MLAQESLLCKIFMSAPTDAQSASLPNTASSTVSFFDDEGNETRLSCAEGDLIATAITGPNAGKTVNLTFGKWT